MNLTKTWATLLAFVVFGFVTYAAQGAEGPSTIKMLSSVAFLGTADGHGSGVFVAPNKVLTAKHVARHLNYQTEVRDYQGRIYAVQDVQISDASDVAIVTLKTNVVPDDVTIAEVACVLPALLEPLVLVGHPLGEHDYMTIVHVIGSHLPNAQENPDEINQFGSTLEISVDGTVEQGMSGGPAFNVDGKVVGLVSNSVVDNNPDGSARITSIHNLAALALTPEVCKLEKPKGGEPTS